MRNYKQGAAATDATLEGENGFSLISNETLLHLYANLLKCRLLDEQVRGPAKQPALDARFGSAGREATVVGVAMDLVPEDTIWSADNSAIVGFLSGVPLATVLQSSRSAGTQTELAARLLAGMHSALGAALSYKTRKNGKVVVIFWRGEASDDWEVALESALAHGLPIIFVQQADPSRDRGSWPARSKTESLPGNDELELPSITVDGNDVVAVYRVAHESIGRARLGRGPTLIQCIAFRVKGQRKTHDSIANMENYLRGKGLFKRELKKRTVEDFTRELNAAMKLSRTRSRARNSST